MHRDRAHACGPRMHAEGHVWGKHACLGAGVHVGICVRMCGSGACAPVQGVGRMHRDRTHIIIRSFGHAHTLGAQSGKC